MSGLLTDLVDQRSQRCVIVLRTQLALRGELIQAVEQSLRRERFRPERSGAVSKGAVRQLRNEPIQNIGRTPQPVSNPSWSITRARHPCRTERNDPMDSLQRGDRTAQRYPNFPG